MDFYDAVNEVLDKAGDIRLPEQRLDVVTLAMREFAKYGYCKAEFIEPIEQVMKESLRNWTTAQSREIWDSTETGAQGGIDFDDLSAPTIDMELEGDQTYHIIEQLSDDGEKDRLLDDDWRD